jgi:hypothetical protein
MARQVILATFTPLLSTAFSLAFVVPSCHTRDIALQNVLVCFGETDSLEILLAGFKVIQLDWVAQNKIFLNTKSGVGVPS